jgi:uncharacterized protein YbbC (DUF1343 family)
MSKKSRTLYLAGIRHVRGQGLALLLASCVALAPGRPAKPAPAAQQQIIPGAWRMERYINLLKGRRVAVFANQTATVGPSHLVDTLLHSGIQVVRIFSPEHGFRGNADAGEQIASTKDSATGIEVVSLYGNHLKPSATDLADIDVMVFDVQDVGVRFYTYISSLQYYIEAARANQKPLILLDRPNPNGFYVDGPVLDTAFRSFVGMQPIPVVYGMTLGEYAKMLLGEGWLANSVPSSDQGFSLTVIPCAGYTHRSHYELPVKPSPNLPNMQSIYLYPSLCFFEGTAVSLGRGTDLPFQCFGHPSFPSTGYSFTPLSRAGAKNPPEKDQVCNGYNLSAPSNAQLLARLQGRIQLGWVLEAYRLFPDKTTFFNKNRYFDKLAGTDRFAAQIKAGLSEKAIRQSWEPGIRAFKAIRAKYLLYPE